MEGKDLNVMMEEMPFCFSNLILHIAKNVWKKEAICITVASLGVEKEFSHWLLN